MKQYEFYDYGEFEQFVDPDRTPLAQAVRRPVYYDKRNEFGVPDDEKSQSRYEQIPDKSAVFNDRDGELAYMSSDRYDLIQHSEVFSAIKEAVDQTVGDIDFGMVRDYGARVDGILVFSNQDEALIDMRELLGDSYIPPEGRPQTDPTAEESRWRDSVGLGMRFRNSFDGGTKVGGSTMGYRYICQNWLVWDEAEIGSVERQHMRQVEEPDGLEPDFFEEIIHDVFEVKDEVSSVLQQAEENELPLTWVPDMLDSVGFGKNYQKRITGRVLAQKPYLSDTGGDTTMWRVYNATTNELDRRTAQDASAYTYDEYQSFAWEMVNDEPEAPEEEPDIDDLEEFAIRPTA